LVKTNIFGKKTWLTIALIALALVVYCCLPGSRPAPASRYDRLEVEKSKRLLHAFSKGKCLKTYRIALGQQPVGHKEFEGDGKTPEGIYQISIKNRNSRFHKSLGISYPDKKDIEHARQLGKPPGGDVMIHGLMNRFAFLGKRHRMQDWTLGCIAVTNEEIDELFYAVNIGTPIEIKP
jgi:murein L,D-transpeptidase YafK